MRLSPRTLARFPVALCVAAVMLMTLFGCTPKPPFELSGVITVKGSSAEALEGVTVSFTGGHMPVTTGDDGRWSQSGFKGPVIVTPSMTGWTFTPASRTLSTTSKAVNFEGSPIAARAERIAFASNRPTYAGSYDLYVMNADGSDTPTKVPVMYDDYDAHGMCPSWSPAGDRIAFDTSLGGNSEICIVDLDEPTTLINLTQNSDTDIHPAWSPNGNLIAFSSGVYRGMNIHVMEADGTGTPRKITDLSGSTWHPSWSPDGNSIVFVFQDPDLTSANDIYVVAADGSGDPTKLTKTDAFHRKPSWSPNGDRIAYSADNDIFLMNPDGSGVVNLTNTPTVNEDDPAWSPDGTKIVFCSNSGSDFFELYTMNSDGTGVAKLNSNPEALSGNDMNPAWSR